VIKKILQRVSFLVLFALVCGASGAAAQEQQPLPKQKDPSVIISRPKDPPKRNEDKKKDEDKKTDEEKKSPTRFINNSSSITFTIYNGR